MGGSYGSGLAQGVRRAADFSQLDQDIGRMNLGH